ncbi:MAG: fibronectin type III domain-containing protein [Gemmatimonadota bacterium]|nr:fibronectin type III domain-containing protein [Gemmatimonadota bacterium]
MKHFGTIVPLLVMLAAVPSRAVVDTDFNRDGRSDIVDVVAMLIYQRDHPGGPRGDCNGDGETNIADAIALLIAITGKPSLVLSDLALTNHTGTSFVLSWRTSHPATESRVLYGRDPNNLDRIAVDSSTLTQPGRIHFVQLIHLDPDTVYYYRVRSAGVEFAIAPGGIGSAATNSQVLTPGGLLMEGWVEDWNGQALERVLVRSFLKWEPESKADSSMWRSDLTDSEGKFVAETANYRMYGGGARPYFMNEMWIHLKILGQNWEVLRDSVLLTGQIHRAQWLGTYKLP